jgi:hypothetical protein
MPWAGRCEVVRQQAAKRQAGHVGDLTRERHPLLEEADPADATTRLGCVLRRGRRGAVAAPGMGVQEAGRPPLSCRPRRVKKYF